MTSRQIDAIVAEIKAQEARAERAETKVAELIQVQQALAGHVKAAFLEGFDRAQEQATYGGADEAWRGSGAKHAYDALVAQIHQANR